MRRAVKSDGLPLMGDRAAVATYRSATARDELMAPKVGKAGRQEAKTEGSKGSELSHTRRGLGNDAGQRHRGAGLRGNYGSINPR